MFTFNKTTGTYNVKFGNVNVPQTSKLKKIKKLIPEDQDPIFLIPSGSSVVVFDKETGRYTRTEKGKQQMDPAFEEEWLEPDSEEETDDDEMEQLEFEIKRDMKRKAVVDLTMDDILDDVTGPEVMDEEDEIYQMELQIQQDLEPEEEDEEEDEEDEEDEVMIPRDAFIDTHNIGLAKGINAAVKEAGRNIPKTVLERSPPEVFERANMVKLSYDISGARNNADLDAAVSEFQDAVRNESLVFMPGYSNRDAAVVYDSAKGVYHVAFHGANAAGGNAKEDWQSIKDVMNLKFDKNPQYLRSEKNLELFLNHLTEADPTAGVELTGYSLGGSTSLHLGEKFNLNTMNLNAFTSPLSKYKIDDAPSLLRARQQMVRIVNDPYTGQSAIRPPRHGHNRDYTTLLPLKENVSFDDAHGLDQFTSKRPRSVNSFVEKSNVVGQGLGKAATVAGAIYGGYSGYKQGRDNSGSLSEESYRAVLGTAEATVPIVGEGDIVTSGIIGFTQGEISNAFHFVKDSIFGKKEKPKEPDFLPGYVQVSGEGFTTPPVAQPTRRNFGPELFTETPRRNFGPQDSPQPFPPNPNQMQ